MLLGQQDQQELRAIQGQRDQQGLKGAQGQQAVQEARDLKVFKV